MRVTMIKRYFIDTKCNRIDYGDEYSHDALAHKIVSKDSLLNEEYSKVKSLGFISESAFLVMKGYIYMRRKWSTI